MTEQELNALLRPALLEAIRADWAQTLEDAEGREVVYSQRYRRRMNKLLQDPFGYLRRKKALPKVAGWILAAAAVGGALLLSNPTVQAWARELWTAWFPTHTEYRFTGQPGGEPGRWRPAYLPEGYREAEALEVEGYGSVTFTHPDGGEIQLRYDGTDPGSGFAIDNEHAQYERITLATGRAADLYVSQGEDWPSYLVWVSEEETTAFLLSGYVNETELVKMAESVERVSEKS